MSIEAQLQELNANVKALTQALGALGTAATNVTAPAEAALTGAAEAAGSEAAKNEKAPELVWYHQPETRQVWQEEEQGRRKGITKVDEGTAQKLIDKYRAEDEEADQQAAAQAADDGESTGSGGGDFDMDLGGEDDADDKKFDESQEMGDDEFAKHWREFTKAAVQQAKDNGADDEEAQTEVKKFVVPLVKELVPEGEKPKIAGIPAEKRAVFLNRAQAFFA